MRRFSDAALTKKATRNDCSSKICVSAQEKGEHLKNQAPFEEYSHSTGLKMASRVIIHEVFDVNYV